MHILIDVISGDQSVQFPLVKYFSSHPCAAFEARVARSLVRGLYLRFAADPTVSGMAMIAFRNGVNAVFSAVDAAAILA